MTVTLRAFAAFVLLAWSPAFAQTICHDIYHFQGERYFGCTKTGKFLCQHDVGLEGDRSTRNGQ